MSDVSHLRPVESGENQREVVDCWLIPENLPTDIAVVWHRPAVREWKYSPDRIMLLPTTQVPLSELVEQYRDFSMGYHQLNWFLHNQSEIPESWEPFKILFLSFEFRREQWAGYVYGMQKSDNGWHRTEERFDAKPPHKISRIIMMK